MSRIIKAPILDKNNVVINVVVLDLDVPWEPPEGCTIGKEGGNRGDTWTGSRYQPPTIAAPLPPPDMKE